MVTHSTKSLLLDSPFEYVEIEKYKEQVHSLHKSLEESNNLTGWIDYPLENHNTLFEEINNVANEIKNKADVLVVVGIGGSYLGAKAIQDALTPYFGQNHNGIEVVYAGHNMSGAYISQLLSYLKDKEVYINVISKSGSTMEPALSFRILRSFIEEQYGAESINRIIVTTDSEKGILKNMADEHGYRRFVIPSNIGGRFSVLTPVGLIPISVAGIDILSLMNGAKNAAIDLKESNLDKNYAYQYAVIRNILYRNGYNAELLASFEPSLQNFHEWWKQLFGESEGKEKKGLFPSTVIFSTDLHSLGQFIQDGSQILFETILHFNETENDFEVPLLKHDDDQLNSLAGRTLNEINSIAKTGTALAHSEGGVPVIKIVMQKLDEYHIGYLIYFFMKACAMSALLLGVNPFDQPGVEAYKKKIQELLNKEKALI